jgi:hypothetical protein
MKELGVTPGPGKQMPETLLQLSRDDAANT